MRLLQGAYGILPTPFHGDGQVDYRQITRMVTELRETPVRGIVVCGSTSESAMLSEEENNAIMKTAAEALEGSGKVLICGAAAADAPTIRRYLQYARTLGAVAALVPPPYYFSYSGEEVLAFYRSLAMEDGVPVVAYQIPMFASDIPLDIVPKLLQLQHIVGLKNSSANIKQMMHQIELRDQLRPDFSLLTGTDDALLPALAGGCDGSFTALGCILPDQLDAIYDAFEQGQLRKAQELQKRLLPILRMADSFAFPVGYKLLAEAAGRMVTGYRQSLPEETSAKMKQIKEEMRAAIRLLEQE